MPKQYLGDGVYIEADIYGDYVLTAEIDYRVTNAIVLKPQVYAGLVCYITNHAGRQGRGSRN